VRQRGNLIHQLEALESDLFDVRNGVPIVTKTDLTPNKQAKTCIDERSKAKEGRGSEAEGLQVQKVVY